MFSASRFSPLSGAAARLVLLVSDPNIAVSGFIHLRDVDAELIGGDLFLDLRKYLSESLPLTRLDNECIVCASAGGRLLLLSMVLRPARKPVCVSGSRLFSSTNSLRWLFRIHVNNL